MNATITSAVVYEVNVDIDAQLRFDYLHWLNAHVEEICALPGFSGASVFEVSDPPAAPGRASLCVQYRVTDQAAMDAYLRDHAPKLRADGIARFGDRFSASRRVLSRLS